MKIFRIMVLVLVIVMISAPTTTMAADFDWIKDFSMQAQADPTGFRAQLASRFRIGDAEISAVLGNLPDPADAYMALRLGEMSHHSPEEVIDVYKANQGKGWGVMAKELGIKPGSQEFQALKKGHDFGGEYGGSGKKVSKSNHKDSKKGKERGKK